MPARGNLPFGLGRARRLALPAIAILACIPPVPAAELHYMDVRALGAAMDGGELDAETLVRHLLERIAALDDAGPRLNAFIEIDPRSLEVARALDRERRRTGPRSPLHGIPVVLKANIDTGDGMATSAGSLALASHRAPDDAFLVAALRDAGMIVLGKANLSEWANFRSSRSVSGWSSAGGQTRNPHVLDRSPCGSSSGSAVAVAAGLAPLAVGTETNGSIVCPAASTGIVGIKPTLGLVSRDGIVPIAHSQDSAGPMARTVAGAALLLEALARRDPAAERPGGADRRTGKPTRSGESAADTVGPGRDENLADSDSGKLGETTRFTGDRVGRDFEPASYVSSLDRDALRGARIGVWRDHHGAGERADVEEVLSSAIERLRTCGAEIVDPVTVELPGSFGEAAFELLLYEFRNDLNAYLATAGVDASVDTLIELIAFNERHAAEVMPWFRQELFEQAAQKGRLDEEAYLEARRKSVEAAREKLASVLEELELDALVAPTNAPAWKIDFVDGDRFSLGSSQLAAVAGTPNVTVPAGRVHGLPIGLSFLGPALSERRLIGYAYAFEQAGGAWRAPAFAPSLED